MESPLNEGAGELCEKSSLSQGTQGNPQRVNHHIHGSSNIYMDILHIYRYSSNRNDSLTDL